MPPQKAAQIDTKTRKLTSFFAPKEPSASQTTASSNSDGFRQSTTHSSQKKKQNLSKVIPASQNGTSQSATRQSQLEQEPTTLFETAARRQNGEAANVREAAGNFRLSASANLPALSVGRPERHDATSNVPSVRAPPGERSSSSTVMMPSPRDNDGHPKATRRERIRANGDMQSRPIRDLLPTESTSFSQGSLAPQWSSQDPNQYTDWGLCLSSGRRSPSRDTQYSSSLDGHRSLSPAVAAPTQRRKPTFIPFAASINTVSSGSGSSSQLDIPTLPSRFLPPVKDRFGAEVAASHCDSSRKTSSGSNAWRLNHGLHSKASVVSISSNSSSDSSPEERSSANNMSITSASDRSAITKLHGGATSTPVGPARPSTSPALGSLFSPASNLRAVSLKRSHSPLAQPTSSKANSNVLNHSAARPPRPPVKRNIRIDTTAAVGPSAMLESGSPAMRLGIMTTAALGGSNSVMPSPSKRRRVTSSRPPTPLGEHPESSFSPTAIDQAELDGMDTEIVPTSQSDEQELVLPPIMTTRDGDEVKMSVDRWRTETYADMSVDDPHEIDMGQSADMMDVDGSSMQQNDPTNLFSSSEAEVSAQLEESSTVALSHAQSPPPSTSSIPDLPSTPSRKHLSVPSTPANTGDAPVPATPELLDQDAITALAIAKIKAEAIAAARKHTPSSGSDSDLDGFGRAGKKTLAALPDLSSDEEEDFYPAIAPSAKYKAAPKKKKQTTSNVDPNDSPLSDMDSDIELPGTVNNLTCSSSLTSLTSSRCSSRASALRKGPRASRQTKAVTKAKKQAKAVVDPLEQLLKEKKTADKRGKGLNAFKLAEGHVLKERLLSNDDDEGYGQSSRATTQDWTNEDAAMRAIEVKEKAGQNGEEFAVDEDLVLGDEDRDRLLGKKGGEAIAKILEGDRKVQAPGQDGKPVKTPGVPLWYFDLRSKGKGRADDMAVDITIPAFQLSSTSHPVLTLFSSAVNSFDFHSASLLLNSGMISALGANQDDIVRYLVAHALAADDTDLSVSSFHALHTIWSSHESQNLPFKDVLHALVVMGATTQALESVGWTGDVQTTYVDPCRRDELSSRLVALISKAAETHKICTTDSIDILLALLLIAMNPTTIPAQRNEIESAISSVCKLFAHDDAMSLRLCTKLVSYGSKLDPINKSFLVDFLAGGGSHMTLITQWVSFCLLVGKDAPPAAQYRAMPSVVDIQDLLCPAPASGGIFDIYHDNQSIDYEDLGYFVNVLGRALSQIDRYAEMDKKATAGIKENPREVKTSIGLGVVTKMIDIIHGRIVDTRAAHLDRSRTKAALQRLSLRIHYQKMAPPPVVNTLPAAWRKAPRARPVPVTGRK